MRHINYLHFVLVSIFIFAVSCKEAKVYSGELGFQIVILGPLEDYKDKNGVVLVEKFDTLTSNDFLEDWEIEFKAHFDDLKKNGVLDYEVILFGVSAENYDVVFLPNSEFQKIEHYSRHSLSIAKRKVLLKILGTRIDSSRIKGSEILSVKEIPGSSFYKK